MEVQDVFAVVFPRALATAGRKVKIPKVYSYTVIVWGAIPHSGQLNRSNSTLVKLTGLLNSNPIWKEDCPLLFTVKSPWLEVDIHWLYYTCPSETLWKLLLLRVNPSFLPTASTSLIGSTPGLSTRNTRSQGQSPHRRSQKQYTWIPAALQHTVYSKKITANTNYFIPVHCAVWCRLFCKWETEISCA